MKAVYRRRPDVRSQRRKYVTVAASGVNSYTITPSGGIVFGGDGATVYEALFPVSGAISFAGTVAMLQSSVSQMAGQLQFAGQATVETSHTYSMDGAIVFAGAANFSGNPAAPPDTAHGLSLNANLGLTSLRR